jgi:5-methylcytosine-specific restriction endonuclease McrA
MTARGFISTKRRASLFTLKRGICHLCGGKVKRAEAWDLSHVIPLQLGGADDESNWDVAHRKCHRVRTAKVDAPDIAKAKRREANHKGFTAPAKAKIQNRPPAPKPVRDRLPLPPRTTDIYGRRI